MLASRFGKTTVRTGVGAGVITDFDIAAESMIREVLSEFEETFPIVGEEANDAGRPETFWLVDPIGGTGHFVRGSMSASTMITLVHRGELVVAVINDFVGSHLFTAIKGAGALKNGNPVSTSSRPLEDAYVAVELDLTEGKLQRVAGALQNAGANVLMLVNYGASFAAVAEGKYDACVFASPPGGDWDCAPGALLVREAGGVVTNIGSDRYDYRNHDVLAAGPGLHTSLSKVLANVELPGRTIP